MAVKKFRKHSGFVIYLYFQDIVLTAVNRDANVLTTYVKKRGTIFQLNRASGKVRGCDPALSTKNRTISHYSLFPALCRTFRVYLLKKPISYKISFENRNKCDELCVYKMI